MAAPSGENLINGCSPKVTCSRYDDPWWYSPLLLSWRCLHQGIRARSTRVAPPRFAFISFSSLKYEKNPAFMCDKKKIILPLWFKGIFNDELADGQYSTGVIKVLHALIHIIGNFVWICKLTRFKILFLNFRVGKTRGNQKNNNRFSKKLFYLNKIYIHYH